MDPLEAKVQVSTQSVTTGHLKLFMKCGLQQISIIIEFHLTLQSDATMIKLYDVTSRFI